MKRIICLLAIVGMVMVVPARGPSPAAMTANEYCQTPFEARFLVRVNEYRLSKGFDPMTPVPMVGASAKHHAQEAIDALIAGEGWISHNMRAGNGDGWTNMVDHGYEWSHGGEIAALNFWDPDVLFDAILQSPGHLASLDEPNFHAIGVGYIQMIDVGNTFYANFGDYAGSELGVSPLCGQPTNTPVATNTPTATSTPAATQVPKPCRENRGRWCRTPAP
jgi:uncharacterized protein YkwD